MFITNRDEDPNIMMKIDGCFVYSVNKVASPAKGLETKFVMPMALPLIKMGNNCWFTWYPKFWMLVTCNFTIIIKIGTSTDYNWSLKSPDSVMNICTPVKHIVAITRNLSEFKSEVFC